MACKHCGGAHRTRDCDNPPTGRAVHMIGRGSTQKSRARGAAKQSARARREAVYRKWQREAGA